MPLKLLFKYTSRSRKDNFFRGLDSIVSNLSNKDDYFILCSFDTDDFEMANKLVVERLSAYKNTSAYYGISHSKINAINRDISLAPEYDILINMSDDMLFTNYGFDDIIRNDMLYACDDLDMFLHYPDRNVKHLLPTMSIMGKTYYQRTNYIYHEAFNNVYADNFAMDQAKKLGKYKFIDKEIFDHYHPAFGKAPQDAQYLKTEAPEGYARDKETYLRLKLEFGY